MISIPRSFLALLPGLGSIHAAIGPITDLVISNADIAPDGFTRSYATSFAVQSPVADMIFPELFLQAARFRGR